ncbi:MAG: P1 family peptidase [Deltaproteobacteria bacterium]|nr:P1 family peptidase [Deltaproteobacteria bacterium]
MNKPLGGRDAATMENNTITAVRGIQVGHATNRRARTGCTVVLCPAGAASGVDVRGFAPGTRETDAIRPGRLVGQAHAILLTGGSAFGLDAAAGIMRFLEEHGAGFPTAHGVVPIVPAAVIYDLRVGDPRVRPDKAMGYRACKAASDKAVPTGRVGAGTGATVGKAPGLRRTDGGIGSARAKLPNGVTVGALVVVNAVGGIVDPATGEMVAGAADEDTRRTADAAPDAPRARRPATPGTNTTIGVVATDAALSSVEANIVASMAHDGIARAIHPAHTLHDGDTLFALSTGKRKADVNEVGILAAEVVARAILDSVGK